MSAVKTGSIFIIKSIMLPLKPGHVSVETPSYYKGTLACKLARKSTTLESHYSNARGKASYDSWANM